MGDTTTEQATLAAEYAKATAAVNAHPALGPAACARLLARVLTDLPDASGTRMRRTAVDRCRIVLDAVGDGVPREERRE